MTLVMLGYALTFSSRQHEAEQILLDAIASSQSAANRLHEGWARSALARLYFVAGALEKAEQEARVAMSVTAESAAFQSWPIGWLARALVRLGRVKEALAYAEQAVAILKARGGFTMGASVPTLARLEVLQAIGPSEPLQQAAHTAKRRLLRLAERLSDPKWREQYLQHPEHIEILARCEAVLL
jgi:tetratricopeptide (TPR) repeat protein